MLPWVADWRARVGTAQTPQGLAALGAEAKAAVDDGSIPDSVAGDLLTMFGERRAELESAAAAAETAIAVTTRLEARRRRMFQLLGAIGATDPVAYRAYMTETLGREVGSSTSLDADETEHIIARLELAERQQEPESEAAAAIP